MKTYEELKSLYPAYISLDQLHQICHIAKRTARYLVTNGIISSIDTGRKTWRYKISIDDVIAYLQKREQHGSMIPVGVLNSRKDSRRKSSFSQEVTAGSEYKVAEYFAHTYADYPDVLTTTDLATMTGWHVKSFQRIIEAGHIKVLVSSPKYLIPKVYFLEFVASRRFIDAWSSSEIFINILEDFKTWQDTR